MKALVVLAHPSPESFVASLCETVCDELRSNGHDVRLRDLWREEFDPVFSAYERREHTGDLATKLGQLPQLVPHIDDLRWCETLILVYPTWWSGQPAMLKGWFDRILMNQVAWRLPEGAARIEPMLSNVRRLVVVTTHGSPKWINMLQGEPGKRIAFRSVRLMFRLRCRTTWLAMYGLDRADDAARARFNRRVRRRIGRLR